MWMGDRTVLVEETREGAPIQFCPHARRGTVLEDPGT